MRRCALQPNLSYKHMGSLIPKCMEKIATPSKFFIELVWKLLA